MSAPRFCRDCAHVERKKDGTMADTPYCKSDKAEPTINIVTGAPMTRFAEQCRWNEKECGQEGKWFEPNS